LKLVNKKLRAQSLRVQIIATPLLIQWLSGSTDFKYTIRQKLDEWPVVASTPRLSVVL